MKNHIGYILGALTLLGCSNPGFQLPDQTDQFASGSTYNSKVDLVLMVDTSVTMEQHRQKLANQIPPMISSMNAQGLDYRIVMVTADVRTGGTGGKYIGSPEVLVKGNPNLVASLQSRILTSQFDSVLESGLQSIRMAIESDLSDGTSSFLREDAMLALLVLSDEKDYSIGSISDYQNFFETVKPPFPSGNRSWIMNFIGILPNDDLCRTVGGYREPGVRYLDLTEYTGGIMESICNPSLANAVTNLKTRINQYLSDYYLQRAPKTGTVVVQINGQTIPESSTDGWSLLFDSKVNKYFIRFSGQFVPKATDKVSVNYSPASAT